MIILLWNNPLFLPPPFSHPSATWELLTLVPNVLQTIFSLQNKRFLLWIVEWKAVIFSLTSCDALNWRCALLSRTNTSTASKSLRAGLCSRKCTYNSAHAVKWASIDKPGIATHSPPAPTPTLLRAEDVRVWNPRKGCHSHPSQSDARSLLPLGFGEFSLTEEKQFFKPYTRGGKTAARGPNPLFNPAPQTGKSCIRSVLLSLWFWWLQINWPWSRCRELFCTRAGERFVVYVFPRVRQSFFQSCQHHMNTTFP